MIIDLLHQPVNMADKLNLEKNMIPLVIVIQNIIDQHKIVNTDVHTKKHRHHHQSGVNLQELTLIEHLVPEEDMYSKMIEEVNIRNYL